MRIVAGVAIGLAILGSALPLPAGAQKAEPGDARIFELIERYIRENPDVIMESLRKFVEKAEREAKVRTEEQNRHLIAENWEELKGAEGDPALGPEKADVVLIEFFDYQCGFCRRVLPEVMALSEAHPDLRVVFKEFPILGPASTVAARASLAAVRQGRWSKFHKALMSISGELDEAGILEVAKGAGLDPERLRSDMRDADIDAVLERNRALANKLGITGTPTFVVRNALVPGALSRAQLEELIAAARERAG